MPVRRVPGGSLRRLGELFVLTGFVIAQPLFDVFGKGADIFVFRQAGRGDILQLLLIILLLPTAVLWGAELLAGLLAPRLVRPLHTAFVGLLLGGAAVQLVKQFAPDSAAVVAALAVLLALVLLTVYARSSAVRLWLTYALPAPLAFAALFAMTPQVRGQLLPAGGPAKTAVAGSGPSSVVMVVLDEFPLASIIGADGSIDAKLYPNFAGLAGTSHFYRNATTNAWYTPFAVPALLTGRYPKGKRVPSVTQYPENLFTLLGPEYHHNVHELLSLCPSRLCAAQRGLGPGGLRPLLRDAARTALRVLSPGRSGEDATTSLVEQTSDADVAAAERLGDPGHFGLDPASVHGNQPTRFTDFLRSLDGTHERSVNFLHILMPHAPWRYLPGGVTYTAPEPTPGLVDGRWTSARAAEAARQRHLLQVRYTDGLIGQLVARLKQTGMWDRSTVVITADHGISFAVGQNKREATEVNSHEMAWVPLFVKTPGQTKGAPEDENAQAIDVLPTIADAMKIKLPWQVDGRSLLGPDRPLGEGRTFYSAPDETMTIDGPAGLRRVHEDTVSQFAPGSDPELRIYQHGELGHLIGARVAALQAGEPVRTTATVANAAAFRSVVPARSVPAFVHGTLGAVPAAGQLVAVAVNGVVGAVGPAFEVGGSTTFVGVVPPTLFRAGANEVAIYLVETSGTPLLRRYAS